MKKKSIRRPPTAVIIAVIAVIVSVSVAVAWLTVNPLELLRSYSVSNFDAYVHIYFLGASSPITDYQNADGTLNVNISDTGAENYIGKLQVEAKYKGKGYAYLRLKMIQQWESGNKILQANVAIPYNIASPYSGTGNQAAWYDNRADDMCLYYATKLKGTGNDYDPISIISQPFSTQQEQQFNAMIPEGNGTVTLKLAFELQAVQVNRYRQFWGIDTLPWLDTETSTAG